MAASLPQRVKFRSLADELSDPEFNTFLCRLAKECGRKMILSALFNNARIASAVEQQTRILENIIRDREKQSDEECPMQLESIPTALIGEIGSYLTQEEHIEFSQCSRSTYCANNMPNTLQHLDLTLIGNYSLIGAQMIERYTNIYRIRLTLSKFKDLLFPSNGTVFPRLRRMEINNEDRGDADIDSLLNCKAIRWETISHLKLSNFSGTEESIPGFPKEQLIKLLKIFPNLIYLNLESVYLEGVDVDEPMWERLLPKLEIFVDHDTTGPVADSVIKSRCKQLKMMSITEGPNHDIPRDIDLGSLVEIDCKLPFDADTVSLVHRLSRQLQRVSIEFYENHFADNDFKLITHMISHQEKLEEFVVLAPMSCLSRACNALERGTFNIRGTKKESLQIKIVLDGAGKWSIADLIFDVSRVLNRIYESKISDYLMSISFWQLEHYQTPEAWNEELHKFALQIESKFDAFFSDRNILISRKDSKIGGCIQNYIWDGWLHDV